MAQKIANKLFPPIKPNHFGYLTVGNGHHEIYYEESGNRNGIAVLYLHGGPGAGCDNKAHRFFNPEKCHIITFDQRGSGKSIPNAGTYANTTQHLVEDMNQLLIHFRKDKVLLFGGSWGSTLALAYAINYPETVMGMVLRGIFLSESQEVRDYNEGISNTRFPEIWKRFISHVPSDFQHNPSGYYFSKMVSKNLAIQEKYAYEWAYYERARLNLVPKSDKKLEKEIKSEKYLAMSIIEAYYIKNLCFLHDGYILKNAHYIPRVPISIIHGRYDDICPVESAIRLHEALPNSKLQIVVAGHSRTDPEILKKLVSETDLMVTELRR